MDLVKLGKILKTKRDELGLSLRDASKIIGISHNYLSIIEKAMDPRSKSPIVPTIETLKMISIAYDIDINALLSLSGYEGIFIGGDIEDYDINNLDNFDTPEEAIQFVLSQQSIMGYVGFDIDKLTDEQKIEFANELLGQLKILSYKYKK